MSNYDSPGKQKARDLVTAVFASTGGTVLDFYGGGRSARQFVGAGLTVTSAELVRSLWPILERDAAVYGYEPFFGRASRIKRTFDWVFADFTGGPSPTTRRELVKLAAMARHGIAVTLSPDRQLDEAMIGPSSAATVPAWVIEATGMRLEYISRYTRNELGQWMWLALLSRRMPIRGSAQQVDVLTIAREIQARRYWATNRFRVEFPSLVIHRRHSQTAAEKDGQRTYYEKNRERYLARARARYYENREERLEQQRAWRVQNPEKYAAAQKRWRERNKDYWRNRKAA